jgi:aminopeptidase N
MNKIKPIYLKDYKRPDFTIESVDLTFDLFEDYTSVISVMQIKRLNSEAKDIVFDTIDLELIGIWLNDLKLKDTRYYQNDEKLTVSNVPEKFSIKIINRIYPQNNTELEGLYKSGSIFCTQNEPEGFRRITPYIDRPDVMAVYSTTVIADKERYPVLLSNGNKKESHSFDGGRHGVTWYDPHPKPSYLFALVAGDLGSITDKFSTSSGDDVELNIYCDKGNEDKCHHAMKSLKESMKWDEDVYGREYDLEIYNIVAVDSFNMGAMENKGLNIFNSHYVLANEERATDANFMGIQSVIAHEYFHNWTGNRITCRDWFQLTLKEGLTVFRDQSFSADLNSHEVQRIEDVKALRERQYVEDASPTSHPIQPESYISMNNFYTATVYEKGAEVIRMLHTLLGKENYRKATDIYFDKFDGQAVTTQDFLWSMAQATDLDLTQFERWYHQNGTPKLLVSDDFSNSIYTLRLTQIIPDSIDGKKQLPVMYPLKMALLDADGKEVVNEMLIISKEYEEFTYKLNEKPVLSINRDFSAPIIVEQKDTPYQFLMKYDNNSFVRYEAAQNYAIEVIQNMMQGSIVDENFVQTYGYLLDSDLELSYKSLLLELPSISTMMQKQKEIDFDLIYEAKEKLEYKLASTYKDKLLELYTKYHEPKNTEIDSISMGKRAIKNRVLKLLASCSDEEITKLSYNQYRESLTMTDRVVALDVLENTADKEAKDALEDFYNRYKDDTLVMNKYLAIIASADKEDVLQKVKGLESDDVYDEKVPNLVRSLIGSFARNYKYFHAKDSSGYKYVADKIIAIDKINAQMASALAGAFKIYDKMNPQNKELIKVELERIISVENLSKNTYEIVNKIL